MIGTKIMGKRIALVYLGRRGGGARLTRDLSMSLSHRGSLVTSIVRRECEFLQQISGGLHTNALPNSSWKLFNPWLRHSICKSILDFFDNDDFDYVVFVMSHPWNPYLLKKLAKRQLRTVAIIHDDGAHKGEFWPTRGHLRREIAFAQTTVFLSQYVADKFPEVINPKIFSLEALPLIANGPKVKRVLIAGRIRKYKGIEKILPFLESVPEGFEIMIAGQGPTSKIRGLEGRIKLINSWIEATEFERLIMESTHVLLPYIEATQSGIISIAKLYNCHLIVTEVGGLGEQLANYEYWSLIRHDGQNITSILNESSNKELLKNGSGKSILDIAKYI